MAAILGCLKFFYVKQDEAMKPECQQIHKIHEA